MGSFRKVHTTGVSEKNQKRFNTAKYPDVFTDESTISPQYADGTAVIEIPVGRYAYQWFQLGIRCNAHIDGVTNFRQTGQWFVQTDHLSDYIESISLEIDGVPVRQLPMALAVKFNAYDQINAAEGMYIENFGALGQFSDAEVEDAYGLGTQNMRSLRWRIKMTSAWNPAVMQLDFQANYTWQNRSLGYYRSRVVHYERATGAGQFTFSSLPIHSDIGAIHVLGEEIDSAELIVDNRTLYRATNWQLSCANRLFGCYQWNLGNGVTFDFLKTGEITKGLRSLESDSQRKRNADIRVVLDMGAASELTFVVDKIGVYSGQN